MTFQSSLDRSERKQPPSSLTRLLTQAALMLALVGAVLTVSAVNLDARPAPKGKGEQPKPQRFIRQTNTFSNMQFFVTNRGVLFNRDNVAGLYWPRGSSDAYIFGGGVWFATKKVIAGRRQKLAEIGYNPNSGAGWFTEGEHFTAATDPNDGASADSKYITYLSPRYDRITGRYIGGADPTVPPPAYSWPLWDTAKTRTLRQNFYFGDYISNVNDRTVEKLTSPEKEARPAILSQEDILNLYSDWDVQQNPEYKPGRGYPFFLNFQEIIYSWSFGRYRDMIFLRHRITNAGEDTLFDCYVAPAFDPDLGPDGAASARNDHNAYMSLSTIRGDDTTTAKRALREADPDNSRFGGKLENLNMAYQFSEPEGGRRYGMIGFAFLESPVVSESGDIIENSTEEALGKPQLGLKTFKKWTIANDPPTQDLRYDFVSAGTRDPDTGPGDVRLLFSTGPFTLKPGKSAETVVGIGIAHVSTTSDQPNLDSLIKLMVQAHNVFSRESRDTLIDNSVEPPDTAIRVTVTHFEAPEPPKIPNLKAEGLDKAVLLTWDRNSETSTDPQAYGLPFLGYELWRSTRSDLDSTIQPDGQNPVIRLGRWSLYDFRQDTVYDENNRFAGFRYRRISNFQNEIPHSFLDVGDDNKDGVISGQEGLLNGVRYYYYLVAFDEYDSVNNIGPLTTAIVKDINFVSSIPTKPPFVNAALNLTTILTENCLANRGIDTIRLDVVNQGRFQELYTNDIVRVKVQPRWVELNSPLYQGRAEFYFDVTDDKQGKRITYDELFDPNANPVVNPYGEFTGLYARIPGMEGTDSTWKMRFTSDQSTFTPNQTIDQTFRLLVDYNMTKLKPEYRVEKVTVSDPGKKSIVRLSVRTLTEKNRPDGIDLENLNMSDDQKVSDTRPHFLGALGEATYEISFGDYTAMRELEFDTVTRGDTLITTLHNEGATFTPEVMPITIRSLTHCNAQLRPIRDGRTNDITRALLPDYYNDSVQSTDGGWFPSNTDPDTMNVPVPGHYAVDAWHFSYDDGLPPSDAIQFAKTVGSYYFPMGRSGSASNGKNLATVHRVRLAGAEIILNAPGISGKTVIGDETKASAPAPNDLAPGDKITISFRGLAKNMPFPDTAFEIQTSPTPVKFTDPSLYTDDVLNQVQVVPNPYIVTHSGQTSTDNAKLYFTRLPPRATIEIYNIAGDLIKTLEHNAYITGSNGEPDLEGNASMLEWNLLSEGRQRIGSQVLTARVIAKDQSGTVTGEVIKKFAVVIGGYRIVR